MGFDLARLAGRLVAGQVYAPTRVTEVPLFQAELKRFIAAIKEPVMVCMDIRRLGKLSEALQAAYQELLVVDNKFVAYSALLADRSSPHSLQFYRTVQDAKNSHRQVFLKAEDLEAWMRPHLTDDELKALQVHIKSRLGAHT